MEQVWNEEDTTELNLKKWHLFKKQSEVSKGAKDLYHLILIPRKREKGE